ncbi:MAG: PHP domain-containing protein [Treponema sp.]|nr:PHP domain-containing protein [Treponema sp.]
MSFLYETHLHTARSSACGVSTGPEYVQGYIDLGYQGIIVTDHFYNGNTAVNRRLPWREWVKRFCEGYEETRNEGERRGLDVFFGWEETFDGCDDYLIYGLDREWLLDHPEARKWTRAEQYRTVRAAGGCVVQAHPFRQHAYITTVRLSPLCSDGAEAANGGNHERSYDALAMRYAKRAGLAVTAGSDIHEASRLDEGNVYGVYLETEMQSIASYVTAVRERGVIRLKTENGRCDYRGDEKISLPVDIRDENDRSTGKDIWELLNG